MFLPFLLIYLCLPILKIDVASGCVYIVRDVPGNRCDIAVPRPNSSAGMAVVAGTFQNRLNFLGDIHVRFQTTRRNYWGVRPARLNDLNEDYNCNRANNNPSSLD